MAKLLISHFETVKNFELLSDPLLFFPLFLATFVQSTVIHSVIHFGSDLNIATVASVNLEAHISVGGRESNKVTNSG